MKWLGVVILFLTGCVSSPTHEITLSWPPSPTPKVTYNIYRAECVELTTICTQERPFTRIGSTSKLIYTDRGVQTREKYSYFVTAFCGTCFPQESVGSKHVGVQVP